MASRLDGAPATRRGGQAAQCAPAIAAAALVSGITPDSFNADPAGVKAKFAQATDELQAALGDVLTGIVAYRDLTVPVP